MSTAGRTDVVEIHLRVPPAQIAFVKFIVESYEEVAVVRTIDPTQAVIVLIVAADFLGTAREILDAIKNDVPWTELAAPSGD